MFVVFEISSNQLLGVCGGVVSRLKRGGKRRCACSILPKQGVGIDECLHKGLFGTVCPQTKTQPKRLNRHRSRLTNKLRMQTFSFDSCSFQGQEILLVVRRRCKMPGYRNYDACFHHRIDHPIQRASRLIRWLAGRLAGDRVSRRDK